MRVVLARRGVIALLGTSMLARLPVAMSAVALVRLVVDQGGDYAYAAAVTAVYTLASTVGQPFLGRLVDRTGRRRTVLVASAAISTAGLIVVAFTAHQNAAVTLLAAAVGGFATAPVEPTLRSLWPVLFEDPKHLSSAYSTDAAAQEVMFIGGPLLAAAGLALLGPQGSVAAMAVAGLAGALGFAMRRAVAEAPIVETEARHGSPLASRAFRHLLLVAGTASVPIGVLTITANAYAEHVGADGIGPLAIALNAAGALIGAVLVARFPFASPATAVRPIAFVLALSYLPTAAWPAPPWLWLVAAALAGVCLPPLLTQLFALTPLLVRPTHATEANAWVVSIFGVGMAVGTLLAGLILDAAGAPAGITAAVVAASALAVLGAALCRTAGWASRATPAARADASA